MASLVWLASCGSSAPQLGPPHSPTGTEQTAIDSSEGILSQQVDLSTGTLDPAKGQSATNLGESAALAIKTPGGSPLTLLPDDMMALGTAIPGCVTPGPNTITYNNCDLVSGGSSAVMNGTVSRSGQTLTWDLRISWSVSYQGFTSTGTRHGMGNLTITNDHVMGHATVDIDTTAAGRTIGINHTIDLNLGYQSGPFCVTNGTLDVARSGPNVNGAARFTWSGCHTVQVQN